MSPRYDIQMDDNGVLEIENDDLVWDVSDEQHIEDTINASQGWWKENFADGVNVRAYLSSDGQQQVLARAIKIQLQSDLYQVSSPSVSFAADGTLVINPNAQ